MERRSYRQRYWYASIDQNPLSFSLKIIPRIRCVTSFLSLLRAPFSDLVLPSANKASIEFRWWNVEHTMYPLSCVTIYSLLLTFVNVTASSCRLAVVVVPFFSFLFDLPATCVVRGRERAWNWGSYQRRAAWIPIDAHRTILVRLNNFFMEEDQWNFAVPRRRGQITAK